MSRLSRWVPLDAQLRHIHARPFKKRNATDAYRVAYIGAKCSMEYSALKRPRGKFYFGLFAAIPTHRLNLAGMD